MLLNTRRLGRFVLACSLPVVCMFHSTHFSVAADTNEGDRFQRQERKEIKVAEGGKLEFSAFAGSIDIKTHDSQTVVSESVIRAVGSDRRDLENAIQAIQWDVQSDGDTTQIAIRWPEGMKPGHVDAKHSLIIPQDFDVSAATAGGAIVAKQIGGDAELKTSGGTIQADEVNGDVAARTSGGNITLLRVAGNADASTAGGNIHLESVGGKGNAKTSGGHIRAQQVGGQLHGMTTGGSIEAICLDPVRQPMQLTTTAGNITVRVPPELSANLDARTSVGSARCQLSVQGDVRRSSIRGKIGEGGPTIKLQATAGNITVVPTLDKVVAR